MKMYFQISMQFHCFSLHPRGPNKFILTKECFQSGIIPYPNYYILLLCKGWTTEYLTQKWVNLCQKKFWDVLIQLKVAYPGNYKFFN